MDETRPRSMAPSEKPKQRASNPINSSLCGRLSPVYFQPDIHQIKFTTTPTYETQPLLIPLLDPPTTTSYPNIASSTPSRLHLNTTGSNDHPSQIESCTSHYGLAHLDSTFMDTSSTWDILGQTSDISSEASIQENILGLGQKEDRVQLQNWLDETSKTNISLAERLEKTKWERKRYEKL